MKHRRGNQSHHSYWIRSAGRPRRENLRPSIPTAVPPAFIVSRALDIQAANGAFRSSKLCTGGLVCPVMSSSMSAVAQSVPCHCLLIAFRWASSCPYPFLTLVTHRNLLCDWIARVRGSHMHPSGSGSLLKGLQTNSPSQITNCPWNRWTAICSCLQKLWDTWRYRLWPGPAIYLPGMEGLLLSARGHDELVLRLPSPDEWSGWAEDPGAWTLPPGILPSRPIRLEPLPPLGWVCTEFPRAELHRPHVLPVHIRLPAPRSFRGQESHRRFQL